jgi:hypothetical protein
MPADSAGSLVLVPTPFPKRLDDTRSVPVGGSATREGAPMYTPWHSGPTCKIKGGRG